MFERFTDRARLVMERTVEAAQGYDAQSTEHLLLGLLDQDTESIALEALNQQGVTAEAAWVQVVKLVGEPAARARQQHIPFTPRCKKVLELSLREALQLGQNYIGPEHILLGLIREGDGKAIEVLQALDVELGHLRRGVIELMAPPVVPTPPKQPRPVAEILMEIGTATNQLQRLTTELNRHPDIES